MYIYCIHVCFFVFNIQYFDTSHVVLLCDKYVIQLINESLYLFQPVAAIQLELWGRHATRLQDSVRVRMELPGLHVTAVPRATNRADHQSPLVSVSYPYNHQQSLNPTPPSYHTSLPYFPFPYPFPVHLLQLQGALSVPLCHSQWEP